MKTDLEQMFKNAGVALDTHLLTEGVAELKRQYPLISDNDYQQLIRFDPTYKGGNELGKYGRWILDLYNLFVKDRNAEEKFEKAKAYVAEHPEAQLPPRPAMKSRDRIEDFQKIPELLADLETHLNDIKEPIQSFKSVADLAASVRTAMEKDITVDEKAQANYKIFREAMADGLKVVYQDNDWIIGVPETYESSAHFKKPVTNWCTAYPERYHGYLKEFGGKYYIHLNKHTGDLYQLHAESDQFKDASDKEIDLRDFINKSPQLKQFYDRNLPTNRPFCWSLLTKEPSKKDVISVLEYFEHNYFSYNEIRGILQYVANSKYEDLKDSPLVIDLFSDYDWPGSEMTHEDGHFIISVNDFGEFFGDTIDSERACNNYVAGDEVVDYLEPSVFEDDVADSIYDNLTDEHGLDTQNIQEILDGNIESYTDDLIANGFDENTATDLASKVQEYLENDFGDGMGATNTYGDCILNGTLERFSDDFVKSFDCKYIENDSLACGSGGLKYKIPTETYLKFFATESGIDVVGELDNHYILHFLYGNYPTRGIFSEPPYGWEGFDVEQWNEACKKFQEFLNELFGKNG